MKRLTAEEVTQQTVLDLFDYDAEEGVLAWKQRTGTALAGQVAGYIKGSGYRYIRVGSRDFAAHRLIWLWHKGSWPKRHIDHIDRVKANNRIENLRDVTRSENMLNQSFSKANKTGYRGVYSRNRNSNGGCGFYAAIGINGALVYLGTYDTAWEANLAYISGRALFGMPPAPEHSELNFVN